MTAMQAWAFMVAVCCTGMASAGEPIAFGQDAGAEVDPRDQPTAQLATTLFRGLYSETRMTAPDELRRRVGELAAMSTDLDPRMRVQGAFALGVIGRGDVLSLTAFVPVAGAPPFEHANAAFLRCAVRRDCVSAVAQLRALATTPAKDAGKGRGGAKGGGKGGKLHNLEAVLLLSLIKQDGYATFVDSLRTEDPAALQALAVAKARHALTFPDAR